MDFEPTAIVTVAVAGINLVGVAVVKPLFGRLKAAEEKLMGLPKEYVLKDDHNTAVAEIRSMLQEVRNDVKELLKHG